MMTTGGDSGEMRVNEHRRGDTEPVSWNTTTMMSINRMYWSSKQHKQGRIKNWSRTSDFSSRLQESQDVRNTAIKRICSSKVTKPDIMPTVLKVSVVA